jgi:integrase
MANIEVRKSIDGKDTYRVKIRLKGFPQQTATFDRLTDAKKWVQNTESAIREGRHFKTTQSKKFNLSNVIDKYLDEYLANNQKRKVDVVSKLNWWKDSIGYVVLADLTTSLIVKTRQLLIDNPKSNGGKRSLATVNRYMNALSHCLNIAMNEWDMLEKNPIKKISKLKEPKGRVRYLSADERKRLMDALKESSSEYLYPIVLFALSTGARAGEILSLKWDQVDFKNQKVTLYETKNGEIRVLPLMSLALKVFKELYKNKNKDTDLLFPSYKDNQKPVQIRESWETALRRADITDFHFHDLRHSCASELAMNGATPAEIAEVLGHKTLQMVKRYAHLSQAHTSGVVERMNKKIFGE